MKQQTINKYAHLEYETLHKLKITIPEYWYLDMVYQLSREGWCFKSLNSIAIDMRMTKRGVAVMRDRMIARGFIKKNRKGYVRTEVAYNSVIQLDKKVYNSVHKSYNSVPPTVELSATKNNNRSTIELSEVERKKARKNIAKLKQQFLERKRVVT